MRRTLAVAALLLAAGAAQAQSTYLNSGGAAVSRSNPLPAEAVIRGTATTSSFTQPATGSTVSVAVSSSAGFLAGGIVHVRGGGLYQVSSVSDTTHLVLTNLGASANAAQGATVASGGAVAGALSVSAPDLAALLQSLVSGLNTNGQTTLAGGSPVSPASDYTAPTTRIPAGKTAWSCTVDNVTSDTQCQASATGLVLLEAMVANGGTAQTLRIVSGTGTACATSTAVVLPSMFLPANSGGPVPLQVGQAITAGHNICLDISGTTAASVRLAGYRD